MAKKEKVKRGLKMLEKIDKKRSNAIKKMNTKCFKKLIKFAEIISSDMIEFEKKVIAKPRVFDFRHMEFGCQRMLCLLDALSVQDLDDYTINKIGVTRRQAQDYLTTLRAIIEILGAV